MGRFLIVVVKIKVNSSSSINVAHSSLLKQLTTNQTLVSERNTAKVKRKMNNIGMILDRIIEIFVSLQLEWISRTVMMLWERERVTSKKKQTSTDDTCRWCASTHSINMEGYKNQRTFILAFFVREIRKRGLKIVPHKNYWLIKKSYK